jgi:uncharacterized membrane protein YdbT with pleckstrin-like domain
MAPDQATGDSSNITATRLVIACYIVVLLTVLSLHVLAFLPLFQYYVFVLLDLLLFKITYTHVRSHGYFSRPLYLLDCFVHLKLVQIPSPFCLLLFPLVDQ